MKIKSVTVAMILALTSAMVVLPSAANAQKRRSPRKPKVIRKEVAPTSEPAESEEAIEVRRQLDELAKLSPEQKTKLRDTIALIQLVIRQVKLGGFPTYFMSDFGGDAKKVETAFNECLTFLPDGLMPSAIQGSLRALVDAWIVDQSESHGIVDARVIGIIDRYKLQDTSLYLITREVLDIAAGRAAVAARMFEMIPAPISKP